MLVSPEPSPFDDKQWYQIATASKLQPLTSPHFVEYARRRGFTQYSEEELAIMFNSFADFAGTSPEIGLPPYQLSVALDNLSCRLSRK